MYTDKDGNSFKHIVYTGMIDEYFEYQFGALEYRSLRFEHELLHEKNAKLLLKYKELAEKEENVFFGGRLGSYQYYDMDQVVEDARKLAERVQVLKN